MSPPTTALRMVKAKFPLSFCWSHRPTVGLIYCASYILLEFLREGIKNLSDLQHGFGLLTHRPLSKKTPAGVCTQGRVSAERRLSPASFFAGKLCCALPWLHILTFAWSGGESQGNKMAAGQTPATAPPLPPAGAAPATPPTSRIFSFPLCPRGVHHRNRWGALTGSTKLPLVSR